MKIINRQYAIIAFLINITFFSTAQFVSAEELGITVYARGTGEPVQGATVVIEGTDTFLETDEKGQGHFQDMSLPGAIKILAPGYETAIKKVSLQEATIKVYLFPLQFEGEGIEIVVDRLPEKLSKITFSASELTSAPGTQGDPLKILTSLPGVVAAGEGSTEIYMRGSDRNDNETWANRVPIGYLYHFGGLTSTINPAIISDINIFLGGFPVEYGDALGGAIDVQLRAPRNDRMHYNLHLGTLESSFLVEGPVGGAGSDTAFYAGARRSYIDLILSPAKFSDFVSDDDSTEEQNEFITVPQFYDAQALVRQQIQGGYLDYFFFSAGDKIALQQKEGTIKDPQLAGKTSADTEFHTLGMSWTQQWNKSLSHVVPVSLYYNRVSFELGTDDSGEPFFADNEQLIFFLQPDMVWKRRTDEEYKFGLNFIYAHVPVDLFISRPPEEDEIDFDLTSQPKIRLKDTLKASLASPYIQQRKKWNDSLTTILGFKYSKLDATGGVDMSDYSPRLGIEYDLNQGTTLLASWGKYLQIPQGHEFLDGFGNPSLVYTQAEHRILGVQQQLDELWNMKVEAWQKPMKDLVVPVNGSLPPDNYFNAGTGESYGLDLYIKRKPSKGTMGWMSYSYAKSTRKNLLTGIDRDFSGDQPHTLTLVWSQPFASSSFDFFKSWKYWNWGIKLTAHSGSLYSPVIGREREDPADPTSRFRPIFGGFNSERTPFYYRLDLRIEKENFLKQSTMKFFIDFLNATFKKNIVEFDYGPEFERIDNPRKVTGLPFFPVFGIEAEF